MSEQRRKRQGEREGTAASGGPNWRKIGIAAAVIVLVVGGYAFIYHKNSHRYDDFARCLGEKQLKMYGAYWCPHCAEQKEKFGASFANVPYVECGIPGNPRGGETQQCKDEGIKKFPTWVLPPTAANPQWERQERVFSLEELSARSGCALP
ncbi:MAG TPA: hypothetical protein VFJ47_07225 [Terriglobales bacterium]|nr:hypothetical protein [Terriglobales bacterium]